MWVTNTVLLHQPNALTRLTFSYPTRLTHSRKASPFSRFFRSSKRKKRVTALSTKKPDEDHELSPDEKLEKFSADLGWLSAFPHVSVASMANFLFGYHIG
ncbi:hypothetical protein ISN44_As01g006530 [Arabidopsis suecica]|uniref:Uncharacterized protein n=1 Tax=Arabidopsis suecica TaxID=45249 RepID=A0A8T2H0Z3_ARASU|nr:hypothetical protein ISN44_As01g006530 [Arabidopsis suecica]